MTKLKAIITLSLIFILLILSTLPTLYRLDFLETNSKKVITQRYGDFDFVYKEKRPVTVNGKTYDVTSTYYIYKSNFIFNNYYVAVTFPKMSDNINEVKTFWGEEWMEGGEIVEYTGD